MNYPTLTDNPKEATTYNGWANYQTWNVSLWIQNDEPLYHTACEYAKQGQTYGEFVSYLKECNITQTPDGVSYTDTELDGMRLNQMMQELVD